METEKKNLRSLGTHTGRFHADEVTACALLIFFDLIDKDKIIRTRDLSKLSKCEYICDVGGVYDPKRKMFDHHQVDYDGTLSSAGMVLKYLLEIGKLTREEYNFFNESFVHGVDANDNGKMEVPAGYCIFSEIVDSFSPIKYDAGLEEQDRGFYSALEFVLGYLDRIYNHFKYMLSFRPAVENAMKKYDYCLVFEQIGPWLENFFELGGENHSAKFVIMPVGDNWKLRGVPPNYSRKMEVREPLPKEWAGLMGKDLQKQSGIEGSVFCHKGRFISVWKTKEDAMQALEYIRNAS